MSVDPQAGGAGAPEFIADVIVIGGGGSGLAAAIEALLRTDLALKSSGGDPRILLERLVVELCAGKRARVGGGRW